jgi:hypothetical protein
VGAFYSYNVIGQGTILRPHLTRLNPTSVFYMDALAEADWAVKTIPDAKVIHRVFSPAEGGMHFTKGLSKKYIQARALESIGFSDKIYHNLDTEPGVPDIPSLEKLISEQLDAMLWAKSAGVRVAGPHGAFYGLDERHWATVAPLTTFIAQNPEQFLFTVDEYFAGHAFSGVKDNRLTQGNEIGHIQPETWKASPEPNPYYYHKARVTNLFRWLKANNLPLPPTVITEDGADGLDDVKAWRDSLILASGYSNIRGWKSLTSQWVEWYQNQGWSAERAYVEMLYAFWKEVYSKWPNIIGSCVYAWGTNNDRQWDQFRLDGSFEYQALMEKKDFRIGVPPVVTPAPNPIPTNPGLAYDAKYKLDVLNIRNGFTTSHTIVGKINPGDIVKIYPETKTTVKTNGFFWMGVQKGDIKGWVALLVDTVEGQFEKIVPVDHTIFTNPVVPYLAQFGPGADATNNDCGPAVLAMVERWVGNIFDNIILQEMTVDQAAKDMNKDVASFTSLPQIKIAAALRNVPLLIVSGPTVGMTPTRIFNEVAGHRRPVICLIDYSKIPNRVYPRFAGAHFVIVVALDFS